ncbi:MAG: DUF2357 domain-containing protein [Bacteroidia bacterium]
MLQFQSPDTGFLQIRNNRSGKKLYVPGEAETVRFSFRGMAISPTASLDNFQSQPLFFEWEQVDIFFEPSPDSPFQPPYRMLLNRRETGLVSAPAGDRHKLFGSLSLADAVGFTDIEILDNSGRQVFLLETEVFPTKLSYKAEFDTMVEEIEDMVHRLAFIHFSKTFAFSGPDPRQKSSAQEWLSLYEGLFEGIERSIDLILRAPHTQVIRSVIPRPAEKNRRPRQVETIKWLQKKPQYLTTHPGGWEVSERIFATHLPETRKTITTDTPENRFVARSIKEILRQAELVLETLEKTGKEAGTTRLRLFQRRLQARLSQPVFSNMGEENQPVPNSTVLTRAPGYRDFFQKYLLLRQGLRISQSDIFRMDYKSVSTLYEYWCFLKMIQILSEDPRYEVSTRDLIQVQAGGITLALKKGQASRIQMVKKETGEQISIWFNRTFSEAETHTFAQVPDHFIEFEKTGYSQRFRYILDAKYRLDLSGETAGPPPDSIAQLHRYRDAILTQKQFSLSGTTARKSLGGVILFPFPGNEEDFRKHRFFRSRKEVNIGAIPFLPGKSQNHTLFREFLDELFETPPEVLYEQAVDYERADHRRVISEAGTQVLIGLLPDDKYYGERTDYFTTNRVFHTPWRGQAESVEYISLYDQRKKKIVGYGKVESRVLVWAEELEKAGVSWPRRFPRRKYLVYRLEKIISCDLVFRGIREFGLQCTSLWGLRQAIRTGEDQYLWLDSYGWLRLWQEVRQTDERATISFFRDGQGKRQVEISFSAGGKAYICTLSGEDEIIISRENREIKRARLRAGIIRQIISGQS